MTRYLAVLPALFAAVVALAPLAAGAVEPDEVLADPALEERAREISKGLRCLVCQNQSIDDSDADLARDLRVLVRERLVAGDSNEEVIDFVVQRYGDFVLLEPPMKASTYVLWWGPAAIALLALIAAGIFFRRHRRAGAAGTTPDPAMQPAPLSEAERARLRQLLADRNDDTGEAEDRR